MAYYITLLTIHMKRQIKSHLQRASKELVSLSDSPSSISLGAAVGVYIGFTPFFGLQNLIGIVVAFALGMNKLSVIIGVNLHTPVLWMWPAVYALQYQMGQMVLGRQSFPPFSLSELSWQTSYEVGIPVMIGSVFCGGLAAIITYIATYHLVSRFRPSVDWE